MSGFAEPSPAKLKCDHCGSEFLRSTSRGPACGRSVCVKLNQALDERDALRAEVERLRVVVETARTYVDDSHEPEAPYDALRFRALFKAIKVLAPVKP
jgi:hypothetical protein